MTRPPRITDLVVSETTTADKRTGLMSWLRFRLDDRLLIDGVTLRRSADGRMIISWPGRRDKRGRQHPIVRPFDDDARVALEAAIFDAMDLPEGFRT